MSWVIKAPRMMDCESRALPAAMLDMVQVMAVRAFHFGDRLVAAGDVMTMPRHQAEYAKFLALIELT